MIERGGAQHHLYLAFVGTTTIPVHAVRLDGARQIVRDMYAQRGIPLRGRELNVRLARKTDAGWLRDQGRGDLADELERAS